MDKKFLLLSVLFLVSTVLLPACGSSDNTGGSPVAEENPERELSSPPSDGRRGLTGGCGIDDGGTAPLSYEIRKIGQDSFTTPGIATDNCLRVRFQVGSAGNEFFDNSDLRVTVSVNSHVEIPQYEVEGLEPSFDECKSVGGRLFECEYGRPSDGYSKIMDFSNLARSGSKPKVKVSDARYDWYCYVYRNHSYYYEPYGGCRKKVRGKSHNFNGHYWEGNLLIQTNATSNEDFNRP